MAFKMIRQTQVTPGVINGGLGGSEYAYATATGLSPLKTWPVTIS